MKTARGFTLIELLVVIAIIGILAGLLLPALARGKALAKRTICQGNLRQLSLALTMYGGEFGRFPPLYRTFKTGNPVRGLSGSSVSLWNAYILPHVNSNRYIFNCPSYPPPFKWTLEPSKVRYNFPTNIQGNRPFSYAANVMGVSSFGAIGLADGHGELGRKVSEFKNQSEMIALGDDTAQFTLNSGESTKKVGGWGRFVLSHNFGKTDPSSRRVGQVHNDGANMAFLDGHVEWAKWWEWMEGTETAARRWNYDNEPHPEFWRE